MAQISFLSTTTKLNIFFSLSRTLRKWLLSQGHPQTPLNLEVLFIYFLILQVRLTLGFCFLSWNNLSSSVLIWFNYWKLSHTHNLSCLYQDHKRSKFQSLLLILVIGLLICLWFQFKEKVYYYDLSFICNYWNTDVCIVGVARTPIGGLLGTLSSLSATKLGSIAIQCNYH